jgi:hypothetical protein
MFPKKPAFPVRLGDERLHRLHAVDRDVFVDERTVSRATFTKEFGSLRVRIMTDMNDSGC